MKCSIEGCDRKSRARGMCGKHYQQWLVHDPNRPKCSIVGCNDNVRSNKLCQKHSQRLFKHGDPNCVKVRETKFCSIEDCDEKHEALGYCKKHYNRLKKYGDPHQESFNSGYSIRSF